MDKYLYPTDAARGGLCVQEHRFGALVHPWSGSPRDLYIEHFFYPSGIAGTNKHYRCECDINSKVLWTHLLLFSLRYRPKLNVWGVIPKAAKPCRQQRSSGGEGGGRFKY